MKNLLRICFIGFAFFTLTCTPQLVEAKSEANAHKKCHKKAKRFSERHTTTKIYRKVGEQEGKKLGDILGKKKGKSVGYAIGNHKKYTNRRILYNQKYNQCMKKYRK